LARKNSVTAENLAALGAERLAALLMELGEANGVVRKRLVLALAERGGPTGLIKAVDRRLTALARACGEVPWEKVKAYAAEVDGLRGVIVQSLAPIDASAAAERLARLIRLGPAVLQRVDDSGGRFDDIFRTAVADLGAVWRLIDSPDPEAMAAEALNLIETGRAAEALTWLGKAAGEAFRSRSLAWERDALRIEALEQLGRRPEAQALRWRLFEETLSDDVLRAYLRALPDFEDDAALEKAFAQAAGHPSALTALSFLTMWPNLAAAAKLTLNRASELDGRDYPTLNAAADVLSDAHPLAATVIRRRMIDSILDRAASNAYVHAVKALAACQALAGEIDWLASTWPSHADYLAALWARHGRKSGFWSLVKP
jgi:hypothetical protein